MKDKIIQVSEFCVNNTPISQTDFMLVGLTESGRLVTSTGDGIWTNIDHEENVKPKQLTVICETYKEIQEEVEYAESKYPSFNSNHEGYAVIKEEVDELWDLVKASKLTTADDNMRTECIQIAAMAIRFINDLL